MELLTESVKFYFDILTKDDSLRRRSAPDNFPKEASFCTVKNAVEIF